MIKSMTESITLRTVERFPEPLFTELVQRLLHDRDRQLVSERFLQSPTVTPTGATAQQIRVGAFAEDELVGWSHGFLSHGGALYVSNSAVVPEYRRQGVYTRLMATMESEAGSLGCLRVDSHHQAVNAGVLIAKLKAGYTIVGTEFAAEMGLLVKMSKHIEPSRRSLFDARAGTLEAAARFLGSQGQADA
jgi:GNAT superfamily N-acetyltransferase